MESLNRSKVSEMSDVAELKLREEFLLEPPPKPEKVAPKPDNPPSQDGVDLKTKGDEEGDTGENKNKKERKRGRNKKRPGPQRFDRNIRLCPPLIDVSPTREAYPVCDFPNCKFIHNVSEFMAAKPADLGDRCYNYETYGRCRNGLVCRFGALHIVKSTDAEGVVFYRNKVESNDKSHTRAEQETNHLKKDLQFKLRRKDYDFSRSDKIIDREFKERDERETKKHTENGQNGSAPTAKKPKLDEIGSEIACDIGNDQSTPQAQLKLVPGNVKDGEEYKEFVSQLAEDKNGDCTDCNEGKSNNGIAINADKEAHYKEPKKKIDWQDKLYLAPLTTVGNLPFRRICKKFGADITCGEMAMALPLLQGHTPEWALVQKHKSEDLFGIQICGSNPHQMGRVAQLVNDGHIDCDFVDINMGCPIDMVFNRGMGSGLMSRKKPLEVMVRAMSQVMTTVPLTLKMRTGVYADKRIAHTIIPPAMNQWGAQLVTLHGRSREQRYSRLADWKYIGECAETLPQGMPVYGNGDIVNFEDYNAYRKLAPRVSGVMIARGALIKPWVFKEIKEQKHWDISPQERLDVVRDFVNYGLEHWGSDDKGVENTRRFLLEWLSFLHRYIPVGMLAQPPQRMNERVPKFFKCRGDLETMLSSSHCDDWIKISEMFLGKVPDGFQFQPKHKAHGYKDQSSVVAPASATS